MNCILRLNQVDIRDSLNLQKLGDVIYASELYFSSKEPLKIMSHSI